MEQSRHLAPTASDCSVKGATALRASEEMRQLAEAYVGATTYWWYFFVFGLGMLCGGNITKWITRSADDAESRGGNLPEYLRSSNVQERDYTMDFELALSDEEVRQNAAEADAEGWSSDDSSASASSAPSSSAPSQATESASSPSPSGEGAASSAQAAPTREPAIPPPVATTPRPADADGW
uniref:Uncharacterized protein n=2 Tax=Chromera velia CCMP2878 TaxID=1169474 RepID=A0A0G4HRU3_9ALVE|eukprot:Cvel_30805.t1-p1 / transcript=Cvel_30805.t1 / gene=Cvel_30805 / organism=Chromera_velia_CCMP2878 / gene_product=hypothetical protein / transcript_product=hypothetical protein / location=Cvel_scaffold4460:195-2507(-) / protein_length=180 / sequence_SO=supercontig / SO=protein_coding / is_pseudo=false